jgi:hypothetical protein
LAVRIPKSGIPGLEAFDPGEFIGKKRDDVAGPQDMVVMGEGIPKDGGGETGESGENQQIRQGPKGNLRRGRPLKKGKRKKGTALGFAFEERSVKPFFRQPSPPARIKDGGAREGKKDTPRRLDGFMEKKQLAREEKQSAQEIKEKAPSLGKTLSGAPGLGGAGLGSRDSFGSALTH